MKECSKSIARRMHDINFVTRYFVGSGIDIGGKPDPLALYTELFPAIEAIRTWDLEDGDAQFLEGVNDDSIDFIHSSHCLEHLHDPEQGLKNWFRVLRPGGHLVVTIPDEDLYEQGVFPSTFNKDHKWTFTIYKGESWSDKSLNVVSLLTGLGNAARIVRIERLQSSFRFNLPRYDQTLTPIGECGIEFIVQKMPAEQVQARGLHQATAQPDPDTRIHLNQYRDDLTTLKQSNTDKPPFTNDNEI